jgi:hypothetical protein
MAKEIDPTGHPFKRTGKDGPGPKKHINYQEREWECQKGKNTRTHYVQICTYVGKNKKRRGKKVKVARSKAKKKAYNKLWRRWAKKNARIKALQARGAKQGYQCRSTRVRKCR